MGVPRWALRLWVVCLSTLAFACGGDTGAAIARADSDAAMPAAAAASAATPSAAAGSAATPLATPTPATAEPTGGFGASVGFRSPARLDEHFAKHGAEFGSITRAEYLRQAQTLRDAPLSTTVLEVRRPDGVVSRFDRRSGAFIAFDANGIIRTFFRPNDGEAYFRRQARRRPNP